MATFEVFEKIGCIEFNGNYNVYFTTKKEINNEYREVNIQVYRM